MVYFYTTFDNLFFQSKNRILQIIINLHFSTIPNSIDYNIWKFNSFNVPQIMYWGLDTQTESRVFTIQRLSAYWTFNTGNWVSGHWIHPTLSLNIGIVDSVTCTIKYKSLSMTKWCSILFLCCYHQATNNICNIIW